VVRLTAVEVEAALAAPLPDRLAGSNVVVICADATADSRDLELIRAGHLDDIFVPV
jgi:hypothetical protein